MKSFRFSAKNLGALSAVLAMQSEIVIVFFIGRYQKEKSLTGTRVNRQRFPPPQAICLVYELPFRMVFVFFLGIIVFYRKEKHYCEG